MTRRGEVEKLLSNIAPAAICDDCIAKKLKFLQRQQANQVSRQLEKSKEFDRRSDYCPSCGNTKKVVRCFTKKPSSADLVQPRPPKTTHQPLQSHATNPAGFSQKPWLNDLKDIGFRHIGHWKVELKKLYLDQTKMQKTSPAMYAFVWADQVMYVGKTSQALAKRLYFYAKPGPTQSTNIRLNALLLYSIQNGKPVDIYGYADTSPIKVGIFDLDTAAGLEDSIISRLQPLWNKRK